MISLLAARSTLAIRALRAGAAALCATLAGLATIRSGDGGQSESSDEGEHGAHFDQCFHVCGVLLRAGTIPVPEVIHRTRRNPPDYFSPSCFRETKGVVFEQHWRYVAVVRKDLVRSILSRSAIPRGIWVLGFVSLLMDLSSEMIHAIILSAHSVRRGSGT